MSDLPNLSGNLHALIQVQTSTPARDQSTTRVAARGTESQQVNQDDKAIDAAQKFEALLIHNMLKGMRKTTMAENTSNARGLYDDMLDEKLANVMIEAGGLGVAKQIISQIQASTSANTQVNTQASKLSTDQANPKISNQEVVHSTRFDSTVHKHVTDSMGNPLTTRTNRTDKPIVTHPTDQARLRQIAMNMNGSADQRGQSKLTDLMQASNNTSHNNSGLSTTDVTRLRMASALWENTEDYERPIQQQQFLESLVPHAKRSAERLGTSHEAILAIAALETGWGKSMIKNEQGQNSFNLFGIKATSSDKEFAQTTTTEFINGRAEKIVARFRTYKNTADAIDGFANFVLENPRYSDALKHAGDPERFLQELHSAGYATDPKYADKAISVMRQIKSHPLPL